MTDTPDRLLSVTVWNEGRREKQDPPVTALYLQGIHGRDRRDAATAAVFEMSDGTRYLYQGSWCSPGADTSWQGRWRVSGSLGTAVWDGDTAPLPDISESTGDRVVLAATPPPGHGIEGSLADFVRALRTGSAPMGEVHDDLLSLAMAHGAIASAGTGRRTRIEDALAEVGR